MIAGGIGDHASRTVVRRQLRDHVVGAADLEGARRLHVLALDREGAAVLRIAYVDERRASSDAGDTRSRGSNLVD